MSSLCTAKPAHLITCPQNPMHFYRKYKEVCLLAISMQRNFTAATKEEYGMDEWLNYMQLYETHHNGDTRQISPSGPDACKAIKCYRCFRTKCVQNVALDNNCLFFTWHKNLHMHTKYQKALRAMQASSDSKPAKAPVTRGAEAVLALPQCRGQRDDGGVK